MFFTVGTEVESSTVGLDGDLQCRDGEVGSSDEAPAGVEDAELTNDAGDTCESALDPDFKGRPCGRGTRVRRVEESQ